MPPRFRASAHTEKVGPGNEGMAVWSARRRDSPLGPQALRWHSSHSANTEGARGACRCPGSTCTPAISTHMGTREGFMPLCGHRQAFRGSFLQSLRRGDRKAEG